MAYIIMKTGSQIKEEQERLFAVIMAPQIKKPIRDEAYIKFHTLTWVLEDEKNITQQRLREIHAKRNKAPETQ